MYVGGGGTIVNNKVYVNHNDLALIDGVIIAPTIDNLGTIGTSATPTGINSPVFDICLIFFNNY